MDLLRQAIAEVTESVPICFYAGWKLIEVGKVKFYQFADLKTHQINGSLYPPDELSCLAESLEAESQVVDKMVQLFGIIRDRTGTPVARSYVVFAPEDSGVSTACGHQPALRNGRG